MTILLFFAFLSGIVTILSPCILPVLPIVLSGSIGGKRRPWGVIIGFVASFSAFTLMLSSLVRFLNIPPDSLRISAVILLVLFGVVMIVPRLRNQFELIASRMTSRGTGRTTSTGFTGGFLAGVSLGLVWTPCVGPIMASVISLAITQSVDGGSVLIILAYSLGTSIPMFIIMMGGRKVIKRFPALSKNPEKIQRVFGILMILVGLSIGFGLDRQFQGAVLRLFPEYGSGLTAFENTQAVKSLLDKRSKSPETQKSGENQFSWDDEPKNSKLGDYGMAPEIITEGPWFNTPGNKALSMEDLRGKVVLIDFWTYSCVNCVRTLPHLKAWHDAYKDEGLVIIGVHSPEFAFEANPKNVTKAMKDLNVSWPVVLDNDFLQWRAYQNRYWPAHFFIDAEGSIRYFQFGEGHYEESEEVIRKLLDEAGRIAGDKAEETVIYDYQSQTPEIYLGYGRTRGLQSDRALLKGSEADYSLEGYLKNGEWSLDGSWTFQREYIASAEDGALELQFHAKDVYLVIEPLGDVSRIELMVDGESVSDTSDVLNGQVLMKESRLYHLLSLQESGPHRLRLNIQGKVKLFAFTFG
ncbi:MULTISPECIES: cytochrome c biogenesis protein DipZ [unclassified Oceanispirochaeta]|uniref:cytochrome c biogenesis protein DipZ n=1 Tax=unclassified Oceanispirochaeta TaxID=2635722 RepID=UPI000E094117|nr:MULTISPECIES: cytochrome c biogenesis protein DipZ [unclassified Oceanispirochaeta]MBF9017523.1 cytochrome c biogenesis protein DipZ [Oceanispirochaeta sp. M2]NPD74095.1 cytochrome c biogenesis protein DipZ [Oceanispirochaeta sp. M1]RDG30135.1 cytochrome c biogenesis protein DipZ [Oceanispirochaeta sp. M1]